VVSLLGLIEGKQRSRLSLRAARRTGVALTALVVLVCGCQPDGPRTRPTALLPGPSGLAISPLASYRGALHPYLIFMGFDRQFEEENRWLSSCLHARGWTRYPAPQSPSDGPNTNLHDAQSLDDRLRIARSYGARLLAAARSGMAGLVPYENFSKWLETQPETERSRFAVDFSGGQGEDQGPAPGSCRAEALRRIGATVPASVPSVAKRAGALYQRYVIGTAQYEAGLTAWHSCVRTAGFAQVGIPLLVQSPQLQPELDDAARAASSADREAELVKILTRQALAEHQCSMAHLDRVVRLGELETLSALVAEFPQYQALAPADSGSG
jgi:hypothetical protein